MKPLILTLAGICFGVALFLIAIEIHYSLHPVQPVQYAPPEWAENLYNQGKRDAISEMRTKGFISQDGRNFICIPTSVE